ncbi:MAG: type 1 glutamine amidotransferase [Proteobacteria bacterium]|nr:type 1 glutamine amidotransferase [Pseudomonadota bacterium]MBU1741957.1 type 1 glutamine amidotransferase [Pseudomonadota bacterium]
MSKVAVLVAEMYNEFELWYPYYRLMEAGYEPVLVGPAAAVYSSKMGLPAKADVAARDASADEFAGLIIPGGYAPDHMRRDPAMVDLVRKISATGKPVAAICHAGWMLASAEVVAGKRVTGFFAIKDDLIHAGAKWEDAEVVVDGNLITSRQPDDLPAFMREFLKALA